MSYTKQTFVNNQTVLTAEMMDHIEAGIVENENKISQLSEEIGDITKTVEPKEDDIPKVFFGAPLPQTKTDTVMSFRYISKTMDVSGYCKTKAQGDSSMSYPKKNQTVKLYKDAECTEKLKIEFGNWGKQSKFCFKANWIDLTHARNIVSARLWGDVVKSRTNYAEIPEELWTSPNQGAVNGFPIKLYAGGVYQGRYTINIPKDAWMANMDDSLDTHCILCGESNAASSSLFRAAANINETDWTDEVHDTVPDAIKTRWNEIISFVMNSTDEEFFTNLSNYFDITSLIDYYLFGVASCGLDAFGKNQLYMTYDGQKWFATMYDMDSTWGLWWNGASFVSTDYAREEFQDFKDGEGNLLYIRLTSLFKREIWLRWVELKSNVLSESSIINRFERFTDICPPWLVEEDYADTTADGAFTKIPSKSINNIQQIRDFVHARLIYTDRKIQNITAEHEVLDYIESSGTQYIDTGVSGGLNPAYEIKLNTLGTCAHDYEHYFCGYTYLYGPARIYRIRNSAISAGIDRENYSLWGLTDASVHTVSYGLDGNGVLSCDGNIVATVTITGTDTGWHTLSWYIFNSHGEPHLMSVMRLYSLKMWTDGELVRDFIPVRRLADGVVCLYDKVTCSYFENAGTGEFIAGEKSI